MNSDEEQSLRTKRFWCLMIILFSPLFFGVLDLIFFDDESVQNGSYLISMIIGILAIVCWVSYDAALRGFPFNGGLRWCVILIAAVGVPVYLVKSRGWKGAAVLGFGIPAFLISMGTYYLGWFTALSVGSWMGMW